MTADVRGRDLTYEARLSFALFNFLAIYCAFRPFQRPLPLFRDERATVTAQRVGLATMILPVDHDPRLRDEREWVAASALDLVMLRADADVSAELRLHVVRATAEGPVDHGNLIAWVGNDPLAFEPRSGLWLVSADDDGGPLSRALAVTPAGLLLGQRRPYESLSVREVGLRLAVRGFRHELANATPEQPAS